MLLKDVTRNVPEGRAGDYDSCLNGGGLVIMIRVPSEGR